MRIETKSAGTILTPLPFGLLRSMGKFSIGCVFFTTKFPWVNFQSHIFLSRFKPRTPRDWRSFSAFSAFLVALFAEMYGFPLTIYFLSGWLQSRYPNVDWFSHDAGHLLEMMFGWKTNPHFGPFHILSFVFIGGGFILISAAWKVLYDAQQRRTLATAGPYSYVRHPRVSYTHLPLP